MMRRNPHIFIGDIIVDVINKGLYNIDTDEPFTIKDVPDRLKPYVRDKLIKENS